MEKRGRAHLILLLNLGVWVPPELLSTKREKERTDSLERKFWGKVLNRAGTATQDADTNKGVVTAFLEALNAFEAGGTVGLSFSPNWYLSHKDEARAFFSTLQTMVLEKKGLKWRWVEVQVGSGSTKVLCW